MPIYDYKCLKCECEFSALSSIDDRDKDKECTNCGATASERKIGTFGGYKVNGNNGASVRPKNAGYRNK